MGGWPTLRGGGRFEIFARPGPPPAVEKRGDPAALAREAAGLRRVAGRGVAPPVVASGRGVLVTQRLPGAPRRLARLAEPDAGALGVLIRRVHDTRATASGGIPAWGRRVRSLSAYRSRRMRDARASAGHELTPLVRAVEASLSRMEGGSDPRPFRLLHGDLVQENAVWHHERPQLVDWEFWRMGDPAEDLAYLVEVNDLPPKVVRAVLDGYDVPGMASRIGEWRALVALDAGVWYARAGESESARRLLARAEALAAG